MVAVGHSVAAPCSAQHFLSDGQPVGQSDLVLVGVVGLVGQSDLVVAVLAVAQQPGQAADLVLLVGLFDGPSAGEELALGPSGGHAALVVAVGMVAAPCFDQADFAAAVGIAVGLAVGLAVAQHSGQAANLVNGGCLALAASACHAGLVVSVGLVAAPCSAQAGYAVAVALAVAQVLWHAAAFGLCVAQVVLAAAVALPVAPCAVALVVPAGLVPVVSPCQSFVGLGAAAAAACVAACCCTQWLVVVAAAARLAQLAVAAHAVNPSPCHCSSFVVAGYPLPVVDVAFLGVLPPCLSHPLLGIFVFAALAAAVVDMPLVPPCSAGPAVALPVVGWPVGIAVQWLGQGAVAVLVASGHELFLLLLLQQLLLLGPSSGCLPCWFAF